MKRSIWETVVQAMLPSAMMWTTAWRDRISSSLYPGRRPDGSAAESGTKEEGFMDEGERGS